jgi:propionyl-CoA carboxylase alpha chain
VRVDTGVVDGGEIPMHYDSMIAKLIVHGKDRGEAIAMMREALNGFVIRGISSNIPFQAALLAHPQFVSGDFNTGFIAEHYANGFRAEDVPHDDSRFLVALATFVRRKSRERAAGLSGQLPGYGVKVGHDYGVITLDAAGKHGYSEVNVVEEIGEIGVATVTVDGQRYTLTSPSRLNDVCITGTCNGQAFTAQVERGTARNPLALVVQHNGTRIEAMVVSPRMAELHRLMPFKAPPDMSKFVLSPMPGLLADMAVQVGQKVQAGERVAVIEAMKMENVLFATADGVVAKVLATKGDSLTVDQPIVEFEQ